jgi:hypothetical protein
MANLNVKLCMKHTTPTKESTNPSGLPTSTSEPTSIQGGTKRCFVLNRFEPEPSNVYRFSKIGTICGPVADTFEFVGLETPFSGVRNGSIDIDFHPETGNSMKSCEFRCLNVLSA